MDVSTGTQSGLWAGVDRLLDGAGARATLTRHRVEPLLAGRLRALGREVPEELAEVERLGGVLALTATVHLERVRAALSGPALVFKGPEVAILYPDPATRPFRDVDLLVPDAPAAQAELLEAGFVEIGDPAYYADAPHLLPLAWPGLPVQLELHERPNWPPWLAPPPWEELAVDARPSASGVDGLLAPSVERHALILAGHAWAHGPLERLRDLLDVALLAEASDAAEVERLARAWRMERLWATTGSLVESLFLGAPRTAPLRTWARNLVEVRERTVLEQHVARWAGWYWAFPPGLATRAAFDEVRSDLTPEAGEGWRRKLGRTGRAFRDALRPRSEHDRAEPPP